jgi:hypothetical protein
MGAMESGSKPRAEMLGHKMLMSTTLSDMGSTDVGAINVMSECLPGVLHAAKP